MILAATMMLGGGSFAWAGATSTIYYRATTDADGATVWNASNDIKAGEWTGDTGSASIDANGLGMNSSEGTMAITKTFSVNAGSTLTYDIVWNVSNQTTTPGYPHTYLYIGDKIYFDYNSRGNVKSLTLNIGNNSENLGTFDVNSLLTIHLEVNTYSRLISNFTVTGTKSDASELNWSITEENKSLLSSTSVVFNTLSLQVSYNSYAPTTYLKSVKVQETLSDTPCYFYSVKAIAGSTPIRTFAFGSAAEGDTYSTYIPKVISEGGKYYVLNDASNPNITNCFASYTMGNNDEVKNIKYMLNTNVVYYGEWEDVSGFSSTESAEKTMFSGGKGRTIKKTDATMNISFTVPVDGKYQIVIPYQNSNEKARTHMIYLDGTEEANKLQEVSVNKDGGSGTYNEEVELSAGSHTIYIKCSSGMTSAFDYLMVSLNTQSISNVDNLGYTFSSTLPLDFYGTSVRAYIAKYDKSTYGDVVKLTQVNKVPANTGVLIFSDSEMTNQSIPVCATTPDNVDNNCLKPVSSTMTLSAAPEGYENYVLAIDIEEGKAVFQLVSGTSASMTAGQAYLQIPKRTGEGARSLRIVFDDETTGVRSLTPSPSPNGEGSVYTLSGQRLRVGASAGMRVVQPTKGLYIVNGKKVIVK